LRYAYDTEQKLVKKGIPSMIEAASSQECASALEQHLQETRNHATRLERVFGIIGAEPKTEDDDILMRSPRLRTTWWARPKRDRR